MTSTLSNMVGRRQCGGCTLCCKLLAVVELEKVAGQRCKYQCAAGCRVYRDARMPMACRLWNCQWITGQVPRGLRRPDRVHYVIDVMPDYVRSRNDATGETIDIPVVQVWCDPDYPDAHRDPALRAWLDTEGRCALVRFNAHHARFIAPPSVNAEGGWFEHESACAEPQHKLLDIMARTGARVEIVR